MIRSLLWAAACSAALAVPKTASAQVLFLGPDMPHLDVSATVRMEQEMDQRAAQVNAYVCNGDACFQQRRYHDAIAWYTSALRLNSTLEPYLRRAEAYKAIGDHASAVRDWQTYTKLSSQTGAILGAMHRDLDIYHASRMARDQRHSDQISRYYEREANERQVRDANWRRLDAMHGMDVQGARLSGVAEPINLYRYR